MNKRSQRGSVDSQALGPILLLALVAFAVVSLALVLLAGTCAGPGGYLGKLLLVVRYNLGFWLMLSVAALFGLYRKLANPDEFRWVELPVQLAASTLCLLALFSLFFSTSANLTDVEVWNGYVKRAEYHEAWTEKVTTQVCRGHDSKGNCKGYDTHVSYVRHPPSWQLMTTAGDLSIGRDLYRTFVRYFGNERKESVFHLNQSSIGDGDMFHVDYEPGRHRVIPASRPHLYVNYLRASDSIKKVRGSAPLFASLVRPYPEVFSGPYGEIELDRVIDAGADVPGDWARSVDRALDEALADLGARKEVNVLVYAAETADQAFAQALEESWVRGKKNDVIVILGVPEFPKVAFAHVMAWTKVEEFRINLRDRILASPDVSDGSALAAAIVEEISKPPAEGGYERLPMSDLEYLIADIRLPIWCQIVIVLVGGAVSWVTSRALINNDV